jgi:hypothetical protein
VRHRQAALGHYFHQVTQTKLEPKRSAGNVFSTPTDLRIRSARTGRSSTPRAANNRSSLSRNAAAGTPGPALEIEPGFDAETRHLPRGGGSDAVNCRSTARMVAAGADLHWRLSSRNVADRQRGYKYASAGRNCPRQPACQPASQARGNGQRSSGDSGPRVPPVRFTQWLQLTIQKRIISRVLESRQRPKPPMFFKVFSIFPLLRLHPGPVDWGRNSS